MNGEDIQSKNKCKLSALILSLCDEGGEDERVWGESCRFRRKQRIGWRGARVGGRERSDRQTLTAAEKPCLTLTRAWGAEKAHCSLAPGRWSVCRSPRKEGNEKVTPGLSI